MKRAIIAQVAVSRPDSPEDLLEVLVSPPRGLILSAPLPGADWPLCEAPLSPSVKLHLQHPALKHNTAREMEGGEVKIH